MSELKPCPFCKGEIKTAVITFDEKFYEPPYEAWYLEHTDIVAAFDKHCPIPTTDRFYDTEAEAIEAWNSRAERTCRMELTDLSSGSAYHDVWLCCACGEQVEQHTVMGKSEPPNYCPNCGARVTPKNSETTPKVVSE